MTDRWRPLSPELSDPARARPIPIEDADADYLADECHRLRRALQRSERRVAILSRREWLATTCALLGATAGAIGIFVGLTR